MRELHGELQYGLRWLCDKSERVLDFGCGDGELLFACTDYGTKIHVGIDESPMQITIARRHIDKNRTEKYYFRCGGVAEFRTLLPASFDAVILSGSLDPLPSESRKTVLTEVVRVLAKKGKVLLKTAGKTTAPATDEWKALLNENQLIVKELRDVYYKDCDRHECLFLLQKPGE